MPRQKTHFVENLFQCENELERKMERFSFECFKSELASSDDYVEQFQRVCRVKGLGGSDEKTEEARKDLFLAYVGSEPLQKLRNYFIPKSLDSCTYEEVTSTFISLYRPSQTIFAARCEFERAVRNEEESFTDFYTRLKKLSKDCKFKASLDERIRDRFVAGVRNEQLELEVRCRWPEGVDTNEENVKTERVFQLARSLEQARGEVSSTNTSVNPIGHFKGNKPNNKCYKRGKFFCNLITCPAKDQTCRKCKKLGHFARVCKGKYVRKIDDGFTGDELDEDGQLNSINKLGNPSPRASISVFINDLPCQMEFDSGARISTIGKSLWNELGKPRLSELGGVTGYGKTPLKCLGKCFTTVRVHNQTRRLPVAVMELDDIPLFGLPWIISFGMQLPAEVSVKQIHKVESKATCTKTNSEVQDLLVDYKEVFSEGLGKIRGINVRIHVREDITPVAIKARRVPFPMRNVVEQEIKRLIDLDVLEKVDPGKTSILWSTPTVNVDKGNGKVRICGDFRVTLNTAIIPEVHQMPTFADLTNKIAGGELFSVIDLRDAYLQLEVAESDRNFLTIATHLGFFRYKRLPFGLTDAPAKFQRYMEELMQGIPNVGINLDDIIIGGRTKADHLTNVREVLSRLQKAGIKAKKEKCKFLQECVVYLGHKIDKCGIHPTDDKVLAIKKAKAPENKRELRAFLGVLNFYEKFIPHLHSLCSRLHRLTSCKIHWSWTTADQDVFDMAKELLAEDATVVPYREDLPVSVSCDASELGVAAVLLQTYPDGNERPVAFASRTLLDAEKHYSSIDREALACVFGVVKFHQFLYGREFTLNTDHKPLERIFSPHRDLTKITNNRLIRWSLFLNQYQFVAKYREGRDNVLADAFSRLPLENVPPTREEISVKLLMHDKIDDMSLSIEDLQRETGKDEVCKKVLMFLQSSWPDKLTKDLSILLPYFHRREELSSVKGILMWGNRIIIPQTLKKKVLRVLHQGHPGISAMRTLSRFYVWWAHLDEDIEHFIKCCQGCQENRPAEQEVPLYSWNIPDNPWERLHLDFAGPFQGFYWLVGVDAYSKWPEISLMKSITAHMTIQRLRDWFSRYGIPKTILTDNGRQFTSEEFETFCSKNGIKHIRSTPYHPKTNGQVERFIRTFKTRYLSSKMEGGDPRLKLARLLFAYRNTPHNTTHRPPAEMFLGRRLPTLLDRLKPTTKDVVEEAIWKQKKYHDKKAREREYCRGDDVWVRKEDNSGWIPGVIEERTGNSSYHVLVGGTVKRKHADQIRTRTGAIDED